MITTLKIMSALEAAKLTQDSIGAFENDLKVYQKEFIEYVEKQIKNSCRDRKFEATIKVTHPNANRIQIEAINRVAEDLKSGKDYELTEYKEETEKSVNGNTSISFKLSWGHIKMR